MDTPSVPLKQCSSKDDCIHPMGCWQPATADYFHRDKKVAVGLKSKCKACRLKEVNDYYAEHREERREYNAANKSKRDEYNCLYHRTHQESRREYLRERRRRNPEIVRSMNRNRKARKLSVGGTHTAADIELQKIAQKDKRGRLRCWWCAKIIKGEYHVDHRIPLSRGGNNSADNLCVACPDCNMRKHDKLPQEWNGRLL